MIDPLPVHAALAPADHGHDELEVGPWPHIHVWKADDSGPIVRVRLVRYKGWPISVWSADERREVDRWTVEVRPPGWIVRLLSLGRVTIDSRVEAAIEKLQDQWDDLIEAEARVRSAVESYRAEQ